MYEIGGKQIPATLAELADRKRTALLIWDMENAIGPNAFNYKDIVGNLKSLSAVAREGGVEGTARSARNLGYDVVVLKDCVGSRNRELHELALKLMEQTHFDIATAGEIAEIWQRK